MWMAVEDQAEGAPGKAKSPADANRVGAGAVVSAAPAKPKLVAAKAGALEPSPSIDAEKNKIVHLVQRLQHEATGYRAKSSGQVVWLSLLLCVALPTVIAGIYYLVIASDRFVAEARFAIRNAERQAVDMLGIVSGMPSSQNVSDSYIVTDYLISRDMVEELERRLPLREMYSRDEADFIAALDPEVPLEDLVDYWTTRLDVYYDSTKNTVALELQAFTPEDAKRITDEIVDIVRTLVNDLSYRARQDAVKFASAEVARMELRLRGARQDMFAFRVAHKELDPTRSAEATLGIAAELEGERSKLASQLASLSGYLSADAPSVQMLKSRIAALEGEISRIQGQVSEGISSDQIDSPERLDLSAATSVASNAMATLVGQYQELTINQEFAEKAYLMAMESLERARAQADQIQSYLAIYGTPALAEEAEYPHRWFNILVVMVFAGVFWAVGALGYLTVRDHMP